MKQFIWHLLTLTSDNIFFHSVYLYLNLLYFYNIFNIFFIQIIYRFLLRYFSLNFQKF